MEGETHDDEVGGGGQGWEEGVGGGPVGRAVGLEKGQEGVGDVMGGGVEDGLKGEGTAKPGHWGGLGSNSTKVAGGSV